MVCIVFVMNNENLMQEGCGLKKRTKFYECFRCGLRSFEYLQTYGHCVNCLGVKEIRKAKLFEKDWEVEYRSQFSDQTSFQNYILTGGE